MARQLSIIETLDMTPAQQTKKVKTMAQTNDKLKAAKAELKDAKTVLRESTKAFKTEVKNFLNTPTDVEVAKALKAGIAAHTRCVKAVAKSEAKVEKLSEAA